MKYLAFILALILAACSPSVPRAIVAPPTVIGKVDTKPVESATVKVSDGAEKVAEANRKAREASNKASDTTVLLRAAMDRAKALADDSEALRQAFLASDDLAAQLSEQLNQGIESLRNAETESNHLREGIKSLSSEVSALKSSAAVNAIQADAIKAENKTLRDEIQKLADIPNKLVIADDKLKWWRKAAWITWGILTVFLVAKFFGTAILTYARARI